MTVDQKVDLSIIIVNWNTVEFLRNCLASLKKYLPDTIDIEIIVIDNNSDDGSVDMVRNEYPEVKLLAMNENLGFVGGNNEAFRESSGDYVLLLNSDTIILDSEMDKIVGYMEKHQDIGIATGKVLNEDGSFQRPFRKLPSPSGACIRHTFRLIVGFNTPFHKRYSMADCPADIQRDVECATGAYLFLRRSAIDGDAIFDEDIFMYYEDTLLCYRILKSGFRIVYLPLAPIIHYGGGSGKKIQAKAVSYSLLSSVLYFAKTRGSAVALAYKYVTYSLIITLNAMFFILQVIPYPRFRNKYLLFSQVRQYILGGIK